MFNILELFSAWRLLSSNHLISIRKNSFPSLKGMKINLNLEGLDLMTKLRIFIYSEGPRQSGIKIILEIITCHSITYMSFLISTAYKRILCTLLIHSMKHRLYVFIFKLSLQ